MKDRRNGFIFEGLPLLEIETNGQGYKSLTMYHLLVIYKSFFTCDKFM